MSEAITTPSNFIRNIIDADLADGRRTEVVTRFPPEPNGYLHIGHAKSICLNFGLAESYGGRCHLRFDDTNPAKEEDEYVEAIKRDVAWLGFDWGEHLYFASDYFDQLYAWAVQLIKDGKAYVDSQSAEQMRANRGTLTEPGVDSPYRNRSVEENLDLFERMKQGEFPDGAHILRAKIDMASPNLNLRDPAMYRILHAEHHRTGDSWCIYPMYDFAHGQEDSIEGITHSICTLEFEAHRPLYDWFIAQLGIHAPQQIEFARLNLSYTVMSKRKLLQLVEEGLVAGWDDPRMPTISGMRRRGYPAAAIRNFCERIGVGKADAWIDLSVLEDCVREVLNESALRRMAVLKPLKVTITNLPQPEMACRGANHPQQPERGERELLLTREIYVERDDFMEDAPRKFFRLAPGREVRLRNACVIRCDEVIKDDAGEVIELRCSCDPETFGANPADGRKIKGTIHWVSAVHGRQLPVRIYDRLFREENPDKAGDFRDCLNPESLHETRAWVEPALLDIAPGETVQFERTGYFTADAIDSKPGAPVFNRTATLRDSWAKVKK
ncbi:glutamine--tRNA ligase/YqeY domain fusion protein [Geothermobacter hydrogeniphilus]|uniref:Glutamine--tRNA ligase n=1 Tax=Geothermobacter hydrogeniphilus TaxID=1969733 RepID=A0A1X0XZI6_9BACT|nr:glutamine--tRNA ligase/YqeY domain fusion protein [Geothermobacter hydrogeniphilus]ORJ58303.1 glutamine--tRNA ligase [Geothermobacter hydrogeniphilus]